MSYEFDVRGSATPFPHWIIKGLWSDARMERLVAEFPPADSPTWRRFDNADEKKLGNDQPNTWGPEVSDAMAALMSTGFRQYLTELTGIKKLVAHPEGGGMHLIQPGGKLGVHVDFNRLSTNGLYRRLNCLVYLNKDWTEKDGGTLELHGGEESPIKILPEAGTTVVFKTSETSWHGHPEPLPGPRSRMSLACYYFTEEPPEGVADPHTTIFK